MSNGLIVFSTKDFIFEIMAIYLVLKGLFSIQFLPYWLYDMKIIRVSIYNIQVVIITLRDPSGII